MTSASSHQNARNVLLSAWDRVFPGEEPTIGALQIAAGMAVVESSYGKACYHNKVSGETFCGTHNWGAIQGDTVDPSQGKIGGFLMSDFDSTTGKGFQANYQMYADDIAGAAHMLHLLDHYSPNGLRNGDIDGFSLDLYIGEVRGGTLHDPKGYYGGFHTIARKEGQARIDAAMANVNDRATSIDTVAREVAASLGEPLEANRGGSSVDDPFSKLHLSQPQAMGPSSLPESCVNDKDADELYEPSEKS